MQKTTSSSDTILFSAARVKGTMSEESMEEVVSLEESTEESVSSKESAEESTAENVTPDQSMKRIASRTGIDSGLDLCRYVEDNQPPIEILEIRFGLGSEGVYAVFDIIDCQINCQKSAIKFSCQLNDHSAFGKIGQVIGRCSTLDHLYVSSFLDCDDYISHATAQCMSALYNGLKESKSVGHIRMFFEPRVPVFDLDYFVRQNQCLKSLEVHSSGFLTMQQGRLIASAMENAASLKELYFPPCIFEDNGSYEDILSKCFRLQSLSVGCQEQYQFDALATLLRDPRCEIRSLRINEVITDWDNMIELIENILCDTSSIEAIKESNHTLEVFDANHDSRIVDECLKLNRNPDKEQVIREKISKYYFASVVPEVISVIAGDKCDQLSAISRIFKSIPELSYVHDRRQNISIEELWTRVDEKNAKLKIKDKLIEEQNAEIEIKDKLIEEKDTEIERKDKLIEMMAAEIERLTIIQDDVDATGSEDFFFISSS